MKSYLIPNAVKPSFVGLHYLIIWFFMIISNWGSAQTWQWAKSGIGFGRANSVSTDALGNVYMSGIFETPTITFGTTTLTNVGGGNMFLVKYDAAGNVLWAKSDGGAFYSRGTDISTDGANNVFLTGSFGGPITFGTKTFTNQGIEDIFVVKYDAAGNVLWANSGGGNSWDYGSSVSTDAGGNVFITGVFASDSCKVADTVLSNANSNGNIPDIFLMKYDTTGNLLWAISAGGIFGDYGNSVATDFAGNVYITGTFESPSVIFGSVVLTNADNTGSTNDIFLVKYDATGKLLWAKSIGGNSDDEGLSLSTDAGGNIYMSGGFKSTSILFGATTLTTVGAYDIFLVKYDAAGNVVWAKSAGENSNDAGYCVSTDVNGNAYLTGSFFSPSITFGTSTFTNAGQGDIYIVKYDPAGKVLWAKSSGGQYFDESLSVCAGADSKVYIAGYYNSSSVSFGTTTLIPTAILNVFLAKLEENMTEVSEWSKKKGLVVYPNPFRTQAVLQFEPGLNHAKLTVYNSLGKQVKQIENLSGDRIFLSRDNLSSGVYFIRLTETNSTGISRDISIEKLVVTDE